MSRVAAARAKSGDKPKLGSLSFGQLIPRPCKADIDRRSPRRSSLSFYGDSMLEAQVRVAGALSGAVFLTANVEPAGCESPWDVISVGQLRAEVKRLIGTPGSLLERRTRAGCRDPCGMWSRAGDRECQPVLVVSGRRLLVSMPPRVHRSPFRGFWFWSSTLKLDVLEG